MKINFSNTEKDTTTKNKALFNNGSFKRFLAGILATALMLSILPILGCSSGNVSGQYGGEEVDEPENAKPVEVNGAGYSIDNNGNVTYAFAIINPNEDYSIEGATVSINGYNADGNLILGNVENVPILFPNYATPVYGQTFIVGDAEDLERFNVEVSLDSAKWSKVDLGDLSLNDQFSIVAARNGRTTEGSVNVAGRVVALDAVKMAVFEKTAESNIRVNVVALLVDDENNFVAGGISDEVILNELEGAVKEVTEGETQEEELLQSGQFDLFVKNAPAYKEVRYFVLPVVS